MATKIDSEELRHIDVIVRRRGVFSRSDLLRQAIRLYLSLSRLKAKARLKMFRLINESVGPSKKSAGQLVEEARREEDQYEQSQTRNFSTSARD